MNGEPPDWYEPMTELAIRAAESEQRIAAIEVAVQDDSALTRIAQALEQLSGHDKDNDLCRIVAALNGLNENIITATGEITAALERIR